MHTTTPFTVFVFGSNAQGFHGAGTAGFAMRGDFANNWRQDKRFLTAVAKGRGAQGLYATLGVARGFQRGTLGASYAVCTCTKPGARLSVPVVDIVTQTQDLVDFMRAHPDWTFALTPFGCGYSGHSQTDMWPLWSYCLAEPNCRWATNITQPVGEPPLAHT